MQTVGITSSGHYSSRKRIDDQHFIVLYHIVYVALHNTVCADRLIYMVRYVGVGGI